MKKEKNRKTFSLFGLLFALFALLLLAVRSELVSEHLRLPPVLDLERGLELQLLLLGLLALDVLLVSVFEHHFFVLVELEAIFFVVVVKCILDTLFFVKQINKSLAYALTVLAKC